MKFIHLFSQFLSKNSFFFYNLDQLVDRTRFYSKKKHESATSCDPKCAPNLERLMLWNISMWNLAFVFVPRRDLNHYSVTRIPFLSQKNLKCWWSLVRDICCKRSWFELYWTWVSIWLFIIRLSLTLSSFDLTKFLTFLVR